MFLKKDFSFELHQGPYDSRWISSVQVLCALKDLLKKLNIFREIFESYFATKLYGTVQNKTFKRKNPLSILTSQKHFENLFIRNKPL